MVKKCAATPEIFFEINYAKMPEITISGSVLSVKIRKMNILDEQIIT